MDNWQLINNPYMQSELMTMLSIKHSQSDKARETMLFLKNLNINWR